MRRIRAGQDCCDRGPLILGGLLLLLAAALRLAASAGPLWLDEIWSLQFAAQIARPLDVFARIKHDNNHFLNTLWLYLMGPGRPFWLYRLPAAVAGTLSVFVAGRIGAWRGRADQFAAMAIVACSYLLIHYSSEARGYALAVFFALASYACLRQFLARGERVWGVLFSVSAMLGLLSHPTYVHCYFAGLCWSAWRAWGLWVAGRRSAAVWSLLLCHALPLVLGGALYVVNLRHMELGGGPEYGLWALLAETGSLAVGGPLGGPLATAASLAFGGGVLGGLILLRRQGADEWGFFALATLAPLVAAVGSPPPFLFPRYFLIAVAFGLLLWSFLLGALFRWGGTGRCLSGITILLFVAANARWAAELIRVGRGQYLEALRYLAARDSAAVITVTSDHDHGNRMLVDFYSPYLRPPRPVAYRNVGGTWGPEAPRWLILHRYRTWHESPPPGRFRLRGRSYVHQQEFDSTILSGWRWLCYRRVP